jgi:hypothetical protein
LEDNRAVPGIVGLRVPHQVLLNGQAHTPAMNSRLPIVRCLQAIGHRLRKEEIK